MPAIAPLTAIVPDAPASIENVPEPLMVVSLTASVNRVELPGTVAGTNQVPGRSLATTITCGLATSSA